MNLWLSGGIGKSIESNNLMTFLKKRLVTKGPIYSFVTKNIYLLLYIRATMGWSFLFNKIGNKFVPITIHFLKLSLLLLKWIYCQHFEFIACFHNLLKHFATISSKLLNDMLPFAWWWIANLGSQQVAVNIKFYLLSFKLKIKVKFSYLAIIICYPCSRKLIMLLKLNANKIFCLSSFHR